MKGFDFGPGEAPPQDLPPKAQKPKPQTPAAFNLDEYMKPGGGYDQWVESGMPF